MIGQLITINQPLIVAIYAQIYFVLGLMLACQSWQGSRLALARSLKWLTGFGLLHSLYVWGELFIPLQSITLDPTLISGLRAAQLLFLACSLAFLFQSGVEMVAQPSWQRLPPLFLVIWVGTLPLFWVMGWPWMSYAALSARYLLGVPGALMVAYGLRRQAQRLIAPLDAPSIWRTLRLAGIGFIGFAFSMGFMWPTTMSISQALTASLFGVVIALAMWRALDVFRLEVDRRLHQLEAEQVQLAERDRIGRELHDVTLQTIYAAGLLLRAVEKQQPEPNKSRLQQSISLLDQAVTDIRGYIGQLRVPVNSDSLAAGLQALTSVDHIGSLIQVNLTLAMPDNQPMSPTRVGHLLAITNEALSNVVRHAQATSVDLTAKLAQNRLHLTIHDDGRGLGRDYRVGYGLRNMQERAYLLGGTLTFDTPSEGGTTLHLTVPWQEEGSPAQVVMVE